MRLVYGNVNFYLFFIFLETLKIFCLFTVRNTDTCSHWGIMGILILLETHSKLHA